MAQVYLFGDSITYGAWDIPNSGWAELLRRYVDEKMEADPTFYGLVYNLGIPGETTEGLVKRFQAETEARYRNGQKYIFVFAFGANDAARIISTGMFKVPVDEYIANLEKTIEQAKHISDQIVLLNITPVVESVTAHVEIKDKSRLNEYIEDYNRALLEFGNKHAIPVIDVYEAFVQAGSESLFDEDGLHPNTRGHQIIFNLVKEKINPWLVD